MNLAQTIAQMCAQEDYIAANRKKKAADRLTQLKAKYGKAKMKAEVRNTGGMGEAKSAMPL